MKIEQALTEHEELLLMKFVDGECGCLEKSRALRLIGASPTAAAFVEKLKASSEQAEFVLGGASRPVDLWSRIEQRINAEEHAAIFLGKRETGRSRADASGLAAWFTGTFGLGLSGAVATAAVALFMISPLGSSREGSTSTPKDLAQMVKGVSLDTSAASAVAVRHERPQILNDDIPSAVEVDWMRSDGRVRILPGTSERSPIIWVKRRDPASRLRQNRRPLLIERETPFGISVSSK